MNDNKYKKKLLNLIITNHNKSDKPLNYRLYAILFGSLTDEFWKKIGSDYNDLQFKISSKKILVSITDYRGLEEEIKEYNLINALDINKMELQLLQ